jgi:excisionase family DNA binding protein
MHNDERNPIQDFCSALRTGVVAVPGVEVLRPEQIVEAVFQFTLQSVMSGRIQLPNGFRIVTEAEWRKSQEQVFTEKEACDFLKVSRTTLNKLRTEKRIEYRTDGARVFYTRQDLENYLESRATSSKGKARKLRAVG